MGVAVVSRSPGSLGTSTVGGNRGRGWLRRACLEPTEPSWFPVALVALCCGWRLEKYFCCCYWSLVVPALLQLGRVGILVEVGGCCCCPSYPPLGCDVGAAPQPLLCYCLCWGCRLSLSTWNQVWAYPHLPPFHFPYTFLPLTDVGSLSVLVCGAEEPLLDYRCPTSYRC